MKQNEKTVSSTRRAARIQTAETAACGICLVLCVCVLFYAFRMYRTTKEMLRVATAVPPTVLWYEDAAQTAQNVVSDETASTPQTENAPQSDNKYVLNTNSKKIHSPSCRYAETMQETNKQVVTDKTLEQLLSEGYSKCSVCNAE